MILRGVINFNQKPKMSKKIFLKPLILAILFGLALLCAFYFTKKYDDKTQEEGFKYGEDSYIATYRVKYQKDTGGADSPEECYEAFKSAMLEHNLDKALSFVFADERAKYEYQLGQYLKEGKSYRDIVDVIPKDIEKTSERVCGGDTICSIISRAEYIGDVIGNGGEAIGDYVTFVKTFNNKWQIESF